MKVSVNQTLEVSDDQRQQIADVLDRKVTRRQATRDEMKEFIWDQGSAWELQLQNIHNEQFAEPDEADTPLPDDDDYSILI